MGCSTQVVPSWSKVAMRSSGATNFGVLLSVVVFTKSRMACLAGPSFQEGNGSAAVVAAGWPAVGVWLLVQPERMRNKESSDERKIARDLICESPNARHLFSASWPRIACMSFILLPVARIHAVSYTHLRAHETDSYL